jgi:hypothetical protein
MVPARGLEPEGGGVCSGEVSFFLQLVKRAKAEPRARDIIRAEIFFI